METCTVPGAAVVPQALIASDSVCIMEAELGKYLEKVLKYKTANWIILVESIQS